MYKAMERGWTKRDFQRVKKKLLQVSKEYFDGGSILFSDVEELAMLLDEPIDYKLEWSLIRLCKDGVITMVKRKADGRYVLDQLKF